MLSSFFTRRLTNSLCGSIIDVNSVRSVIVHCFNLISVSSVSFSLSPSISLGSLGFKWSCKNCSTFLPLDNFHIVVSCIFWTLFCILSFQEEYDRVSLDQSTKRQFKVLMNCAYTLRDFLWALPKYINLVES